jgi:hypothetical protein
MPNQKKQPTIHLPAFLTSDVQLIMSLTVPADGEREVAHLDRLKTLLISTTGVISYTNPPTFDDGEDFLRKYGT